MAASNLPGAPFKVGTPVEIRMQNVRPIRGTVAACKPTRNDGWFVSVFEVVEGMTYEVVAHEDCVYEVVAS